MILKHLSKSVLEKLISKDIIVQLETILSDLDPDTFDPTDFHRKKTLVKILSAFSPAQRMKKKDFRRMLLNSLPPPRIKEICDFTGVGRRDASFEELVDRLVSKGWNNSKFTREFIEITGLPSSFLPAQDDKVPNECIVQTHSEFPFKRVKDFQHTVHAKVMRQLRAPRARALVQMPTGSGKTRTAMEVICDVLNKTQGTVVWLAHSGELCEQCIQCFQEVWAHIGIVYASVVIVFGKNDGLALRKKNTPTLVVGGFQKLHSINQRKPGTIEQLKKDVALLVIDEAHKAVATTYFQVANSLVNIDSQVLGLTATPGRSALNTTENVELSDFFNRNIIGIVAPDDQTVIGYLRSRKILSEVVYSPLKLSGQFEITRSEKRKIETELKIPSGLLVRLGKQESRNIEIIRRLEKEAKQEKQILFFGCSVEHSKFICAMLVYNGIKAIHVDGNTARSERSEAINGFKNSDIQVLCNYGVLDTGFDAPKTDVVFISRPTASVVLFSQMVGRGLRGPEIGGTAACTIVNVIDPFLGNVSVSDVYEFFSEYWSN
jgi:DNA repair protein RadD